VFANAHRTRFMWMRVPPHSTGVVDVAILPSYSSGHYGHVAYARRYVKGVEV